MKKFRYFLSSVLIFFCLLYSCSMGGMDPVENTSIQGKEGIKEGTENPKKSEDENEDGPADPEDDKTEDDETEDSETEDDETEDDETEDGETKDGETEDGETEDDETEDSSDEIPSPAIFLYCKTLPENEIVFEYSSPVSFVSLNFDPDLEYEVVEEGSEVKIKLTENPDPGLSVEADLQVKDEYGNTVSELITFRTKNNRVPEMQVNELRTEYKNLQAEYIEFKMLSDGNLGALRVFVASNNKTPQIYEFKPVEVKAEEYVVLQLRTLEGSCKDGYGENLNESGGKDSCSTARDLWIPGSTELLRKTDAVYVLDQDDEVLDAVMFAESATSWTGKSHFNETAEFLFSKGAWKSPTGTVCSVTDTVNSSGIGSAMTRSISRDETVEDTHTEADWYVTANKGATPGLPNNPKRFL
jgi:hypothetical protein